MKKILVLGLIMAMLMSSLTGCGGDTTDKVDGGNSVNEEMDIAYYSYNSEPILTWDPSVCFSNGIIVLSNVYEKLLTLDPNTKEYSYDLATEYSVSEDGLVWNFKLREGVKFHDGSDFTAEDVKYSIERTVEMGQGASYIWDAVENINIISDYEIEFVLSYPSAIDIAASSPYGAFIMSSGIADQPDNWFDGGNEIGTGPYVLERNSMGDEVILSMFDDYRKGWDGEHFEKVVIKKTSETSSRRQMIEKGEADIVGELPSEDVEALKENPDVNVTVVPTFTNLISFYNTESEATSNINVRKALNYAMPYDDIVKYATGGYSTQSTGMIPNGHWGHSEELFQYSYDLEKAKALLDEEGIKEGDLKLLLTYLSGDESQKKGAELYKSELSKIGVELEIRGMNWESQWEMSMATNPEDRQDIMLMYWWPDVSSPYSWLYSLAHSEDEILFNLSYYSNPEVDRLMDEGNEIAGTDMDRAEEMFIEAQEILIEDNPMNFMYDITNQWVTNPTFLGFEDNPLYTKVVFFYDCYRAK